MGQIRHGCATTTHAVRAAIQRSQASLAQLSRELGINPKTVAKWRKRETVEDRTPGPKEPRSSVLSEAEEAMVVAFRRHTLLPLDDCLYALQPSIPHLTRSALHRCLQRHGISRLPDLEGDKPKRQRFKRYPIGFFHMDIAEVQTAEGKLYLFVAIDRTSKYAVTQLVEKADRRTAWEFLEHLLKAVPYRIHTILTDNGIQFADPRDPFQNLDGAARYLLAQLATFKDIDLALAAHNAGPHRVVEYSGVPPFTETRDYIARIYRIRSRLAGAPVSAPDIRVATRVPARAPVLIDLQ